MAHLKSVKNTKQHVEAFDEDGVWAEIKDGELVRFDLPLCIQLAEAFDKGTHETENEVAKLCLLIITDICSGNDDGIVSTAVLKLLNITKTILQA